MGRVKVYNNTTAAWGYAAAVSAPKRMKAYTAAGTAWHYPVPTAADPTSTGRLKVWNGAAWERIEPMPVTYRAAVLALSPIAYWRLGEASGTSAADATGHGHTGTYVNSPTLGVTGLLTGDADTAVTCVNPNVYISVPDHADFDCFEARNPWTFAVWIDNHTPNADYQRLFRKSAATGPAKVEILSQETSFLIQRYDASGGYSAVGAAPLTAGRHLVFGTYDGANLRLYLDGAMAAAAAPATLTLPALAGAITFGTDGYWDCFSGTYDEGAVWGRALTSGEIASLWTEGTT